MTVNEAFGQWLADRAVPCRNDKGVPTCMECRAKPGDQHTLACPYKKTQLPSLDYLKGMADGSVDRTAPIPKNEVEVGGFTSRYDKKAVETKISDSTKMKKKAVPPTPSDIEFEKIDLYAAREEGEEPCRKCGTDPNKILTKGVETAWFCPECGYTYRTTSDTKACGCCGHTKMQGCDCLNEKDKKGKGDPCSSCGEHTDENIGCSECRICEIMDEAEANKKCHYCDRTEDGGCNCNEDDNHETEGDVCGACEERDGKDCSGCLHE